MKKLLVLILAMSCALCLAFSFAGCKPDDSESSGGGSNTQQGDTGSSEETGGGHVHNYGNLTPEKPATCTEEGLQAHYYCENCGKYFDYNKVEKSFYSLIIPARNHRYINKCSQTEHWLVCNVCGEEEAHTAHDVTDGMCETCGYSEHCTEGLDFSEVEYDGKIVSYSVSKGTATDSEIFIPSFHENLPVTTIADNAFINCASLTSVTIGNGVTSIGSEAFSGCTSLTSITISASVTSIGENAFYYCTSLTSITIPDSVTSIGTGAFRYCLRLESITVDESNTAYSSQDGILYNKNKTTLIEVPETKSEITIPDSVTSIGEAAFYYCTSLTSITIPDSVTSISGAAFYYCARLESVTIGSSVTSIGEAAFYNCTRLESVTIGSSVTSIGDYAFQYCYNLTSITIPDSVTSIGAGAFYSCTSLTSITIGNGVTSIGAGAFEYCTSLISITIPNSVTSIGKDAFLYGYGGLKGVYIADIAAWCNIDFGNSAANPLCFAHNLYLDYQPVTNLNISREVTKIKDYAFYNCTSLESVTIPDSVTSIGSEAFSGCKNLENITVDEKNTAYSSQDGILYDKNKTTLIRVLESKSQVIIPDSVTSIGSDAFKGCTSLTSVTIPDSVTSIGSEAFSGCTSLESITLPFVGNGSDETHFSYIFGTRFDVPSSMKTVIITGGDSIGDWAFNGCSSLTSITIPDSVTSIGSYAFEDCTGLTNITIPDSVISIGEYAFWGCANLTSITIPNGVTSIGYDAFNGCTSLERVIFDNPNGWYVTKDSSVTSGTNISSEDLQNPETAATYLKNNYLYYYWKRKTA